MAENKTRQTSLSVTEFLKTVEDPVKRKDCHTLKRLMRKTTGRPPKMWGSSIVGFGKYHYKYESGREGNFFITGFSPRKQNLTIYIMPGFSRYAAGMEKLGKHKTGKSCLYIKSLDDIDMDILEWMIADSTEYMRQRYLCD